MIERNIIHRDNILYHLSQLEYGGSEWNKACDQLLIEAGRLEGKHEENERRWREARQKNEGAGTQCLNSIGEAGKSQLAKRDLPDALAALD